jgi:hypothetical protein
MHLKENAAKWWQAYKITHKNIAWQTFCDTIQAEFGSDDYRTAITELIALKQTGSVEEYTAKFQALQFDFNMHSCQYDDLYFASQYVEGLKDEIRAAVEPQVPTTVNRAMVIAKIQQRMLERNKLKHQRHTITNRGQPTKPENKAATTYGNLWRDKQLRDYRRANNLCFHCGEKLSLVILKSAPKETSHTSML